MYVINGFDPYSSSSAHDDIIVRFRVFDQEQIAMLFADWKLNYYWLFFSGNLL